MTNQIYEEFRTEVLTNYYYKGSQHYEIPLDLKFSQGDMFHINLPVSFGVSGTSFDFYSNERYHVITLYDADITDNGSNIIILLGENITNMFVPGIVTCYVKNKNTGTHFMYLIGECFKGNFNNQHDW